MMASGNRKVSEALERYLDGSADKDEADWIDEAPRRVEADPVRSSC